MNQHSIINKLLNNKKIYIYLVIALITGVFMMCAENKNNNDKNNYNTEEISQEYMPDNDCATNLESRLIDIIRKVDGVGEVDIFINYSSTSEKIPLKENSKENGDKVVFKTEGSTNEPYILAELNPKIEGVLVVAQGGDNEFVSSTIRNTISVSLGVPIHKVNVLKMK